MARPLRGTIKRTATGHRVEVPAAIGDPRRISRTFADLHDAEAWRQAAVAALRAGQPLPDTAPSNSTTGAPAAGTSMTFVQAAELWTAHYFGYLNMAGPERAADAKRELLRICNHLDGKGLTPGTASVADVENIFGQLAGTIEGPLNKRLSAAKRARGVVREGYSKHQIDDMRRNLFKALIHVRDREHVALGFDPAQVTVPNTTKPETPKRAPLTLAQTALLARHLHAVHAFVLLLCRIMALRISEAYGVTVADYISDPSSSRAALRVAAQGGKNFTVYDEARQPTTATRKEDTKTPQSKRTLPVPSELQRLIELVIRVFHTDPSTGEINRSARLIPDLTGRGTGQTSFRDQMKKAAARAGLQVDPDELGTGAPLGFTPHDLRRALITGVTHEAGDVSTELRERFVGHRAGDTVHASYILDSPDFRELLPIAERMNELILRDIPGGLIIPTTRRCTTGNQPLLHSRRHHIDTELSAAGWLVTQDTVDDVLDSLQLAQLLGIAPTTARRLLASGDIPTVPLPGGRHDQNGIRVADAVELEAAWNSGTRVGALADELGISHASIHQVVKARGWSITKRGGIAVLDDATAQQVRDWRAGLEHARQDGLTISAAAQALDVTAAVVRHWLEVGTLTALPGNPDYVSKQSVQRKKNKIRRNNRGARR